MQKIVKGFESVLHMARFDFLQLAQAGVWVTLGWSLLSTKVMDIVIFLVFMLVLLGKLCFSVQMRAKDASLTLQCEYAHTANVGCRKTFPFRDHALHV